MRYLLCISLLLVSLATNAMAVQVDISNSYVEILGPTTMRMNNVAGPGGSYWADLQWNPNNNTFEVTNVGPMNCTSMEGLWTLNYDWGCLGSPGSTSIQFFADGTFLTGDDNDGTWTQDGCAVDWVYSNGTHYWGTMDDNGLGMSGDMWSFFAGNGCWTAQRTYSGIGDNDPPAIGSDGKPNGEAR